MDISIFIDFVIKHWLLFSLTIGVIGFLIFEESKKENGGRLLSCEQLVQLMNQEKVRVLDLRLPEIFKGGHIRNSINILPQDLAKNLGLETNVIVNQNGVFSSDILKSLGKGDRILDGGIDSWLKVSLPLEK